MATILLSAAGAAIGGSISGSILGLSGAVIGRAVGASLGGVIDQKIFGQAAPLVETGYVDSFRVQSAQEGAEIPRVMGRMRMGGQMIWSSRFKENISTSSSGGGKGAPSPKVTTNTYTYSVSVAFALGEGVIDRIGRVWADGAEVAFGDLNYTVYRGEEDQLPDPVIAAVEGLENTPAFRGTAYVVIEDLPLAQFGNRIPQLNFEVFRKAQPEGYEAQSVAHQIGSVALIPGSGEYALATTPVQYDYGWGTAQSANVNTSRGQANIVHALDDLETDLPNLKSGSLVVSWFGSDLRCNTCKIRPLVEQTQYDGDSMPWVVSGLARSQALEVSQVEERGAFGGTPCDASVLEAIAALKAKNKKVTFYPFVLMDIAQGNGLVDPWSGAAGQGSYPWRGRITTALAPDVVGSSDGTVAAGLEVDAFFGAAQVSDFSVSGQTVIYSGPAEWSYRRFVLHYAHLCVLAGGVDSFCLGSEMRGLTQIRDGIGSFPAVQALKNLAQDVRSIMGAGVEIGYAADWSEYFGYQPDDGAGDVYFHLDPLWADSNIDFVGIDNYVPLSDWRDGLDHADKDYNSIYNLAYLQANIEGGEGYDWYYATAFDRAEQNRSSITDGAYNEPWVYRNKDFRNWWDNLHFNRIGGVRQNVATDWEPRLKPIRFTELGCPAVDKGTNQPNVFYDVKSVESALPHGSTGAVDGYIQRQYLRAMLSYWSDANNNPQSDVYNGAMIDMDNASVWAWDTRPWPDFPDRLSLWSDGVNYPRGHWVSGRMSDQNLADVVAEICENSGMTDYDVSGLEGLVLGYMLQNIETGRQSLQPLMLAYGFTCFEQDGVLVFRSVNHEDVVEVSEQDLVYMPDEGDVIARTRSPDVERVGRLRAQFWDAGKDYETAAIEARFAGDTSPNTSTLQLPIVLDRSAVQFVSQRLLAEARVARDALSVVLPPSKLDVSLDDRLRITGDDATYRIDRIEDYGARIVSAVRVEKAIYGGMAQFTGIGQEPTAMNAQAIPHWTFLDLPLLTGAEVAHAPHFAATATPWTQGVSVYSSSSIDGFSHNMTLETPAIFGSTVTMLYRARPDVWERSWGVVVSFSDDVQARTQLDVLNGANAAAIRNGSGDWEVFQFAGAELLGNGDFRLHTMLRGQAGTEWLIPDVWPIGSEVVILGTGVAQISLAENARGLERIYRVGPASKAVTDASYQQEALSFEGVGLRPYAPAHLKSRSDGAGGLVVDWIRRTRIDGDSWNSIEVPLGEEAELYRVRVWSGASLLREVQVSNMSWDYLAGDIADDTASGLLVVEIAQVSIRFGAGPDSRIEIYV